MSRPRIASVGEASQWRSRPESHVRSIGHSRCSSSLPGVIMDKNLPCSASVELTVLGYWCFSNSFFHSKKCDSLLIRHQIFQGIEFPSKRKAYFSNPGNIRAPRIFLKWSLKPFFSTVVKILLLDIIELIDIHKLMPDNGQNCHPLILKKTHEVSFHADSVTLPCRIMSPV